MRAPSARNVLHAFLVMPLLLLTACPPAEEGEGEEEVERIPAAQLPDTTAASVWAYLQGEDYRNNWPLWPGKGKLYPGTEPHGMLLTTYLSPLALDAVTNRAGKLPAGAIVVKENYAPDSTYAAATIMYKVAGYDLDHNDWFWMKRNADETVEAQGQVPMCSGCHGAKADNDYIFTASLR